MGAVGAAPIFDRLPVETVRLHFELDGTVDYDDWHFNVRPSNTEPSCDSTSRRARPRRCDGGATRCSR